MNRLPLQRFEECRQFGLALGVGPGDDEPGFFMKHTHVGLAIEVVLLGDRLGTHHAGQAHNPGAGFANAGGNRHLVLIARSIQRNRCGGAFVVVKKVLRQAAHVVHRQVIFSVKAGEEFSKASAVGKIGKAEVPPQVDAPMAVAIIDRFHRLAVGIRKVFVKVGGFPQRLKGCGVVRVLPVERHLVCGDLVVAGCRTAAALLSPIPVGRLLFDCEPVQDAGAKD